MNETDKVRHEVYNFHGDLGIQHHVGQLACLLPFSSRSCICKDITLTEVSDMCYGCNSSDCGQSEFVPLRFEEAIILSDFTTKT